MSNVAAWLDELDLNELTNQHYETIMVSTDDPEDVASSWLESSGHRPSAFTRRWVLVVWTLEPGDIIRIDDIGRNIKRRGHFAFTQP